MGWRETRSHRRVWKDGRSLVSLNLESKVCSITTEDELYNSFRDRVSPEGRTYMFLDEPQSSEWW